MIAFLGTGLLGANFTRALLKRGEKVRVWNRTSGKSFALQQYGAEPFKDLQEAVRSADLIHLTLSDDKAVDEVLSAASEAFKKGAVIIDHTTTSVPGALKRSKYWSEKGCNYIHAPVFMGPPNALDSTGTMMISGDQRLIAMLEPHLSKMTGKLWNLGNQPEKAAAIKLLGNLFHIGLTGTISDMIKLAEILEVPVSDLGSLLDILNPAVVSHGRIRKITSNTFDQPSWELSMARKDARLMMEQAAAKNKTLMVIPAVAEKMDMWLSKGQAQSDWTIISQDPSSD